MTNEPERYFSADYRAARAAFIGAAEAAGLGVTTRVHPSAMGRDDLPLFLDTATVGPRDADTALLLLSGIHGVEGYFGSAVQTGLLRESIAARAPQGCRLVMLHALNPFGFSWNRRVNEDNVDVNRNFVDHDHPPATSGYAELAGAIAPGDLSASTLEAADAQLRDYARRHGEPALQAALSAGQYVDPGGLYFGGRAHCWSLKMLQDVLREELAGARRLVVLDFHTGLGAPGAIEMIIEDAPGTPGYLRAQAVWGARVRSTSNGQSVSAALTGTVDAAIAAWAEDAEVTFATLEAGTVPAREVFEVLRKENWLYAHGGPDHPWAPAIRRQMRAAFYPDSIAWKRQVWTGAVEAVDAALRAVA